MRTAGYAAIAAAFVFTSFIGLVFLYPGIVNNVASKVLGAKDLPVSVLQQVGPAPKSVPQSELVQDALAQINLDRHKYGLGPVRLSSNEAAQVHAEDVFSTKQISHWMTDGEKPYMTYTRYNGTGNVHQNVAITGFTLAEYSHCVSLQSICETIDPVNTIIDLEYKMMYDDESCCANGHRENILDPHHTDVSIGIVYDRYYLVFVENFEDNYGLTTSVNDGTVNVRGHLTSGTLSQLQITFDELPTPAVYEANKNKLSYSSGTTVAVVARPLGFGYFYEQPHGYKIVEADRWDVDNATGTVDISFSLAKAVSKDGVYTVSAVLNDGKSAFDATSYSIFVKTVSSVAAAPTQKQSSS
ncbi:MAG: CAP domain-containing protein [Nitrososphaera sp.]|jgi:hypothetical protein